MMQPYISATGSSTMTPTDVAMGMQAKTKLPALYFLPDETRYEEILVPKESCLARRGSNAISTW
jgi:hypothetical protein